MTTPASSETPWYARLPIRLNELLLLVAIVIVVMVAGWVDSNHTYFENPADSAYEIARYTSLLGIFALGATVVIISGGIDLSTGSTIAFSATICGALILIGNDAAAALKEADSTWAGTMESLVVPLAILGALVAGLAIGTLHTWLITSIHLPPFIATLATLVGLRSLARVVCDSVTTPRRLTRTQINVNHPFFRYLSDNIWVQVTIFVILALVTWFILSRTVLGRHIYALGGNEQAAKLSGIRTANVKWFAYCFASLTAAIAGVLFVGNESVAAPVNQGRGYELNAIAAAVVGGCSLQGGLGSIPGTVLGCLFLRVVIDAIAKIIKTGSDLYEGLIVGTVVVVAVTFSQLQQLWASGKALFPGWLGVFSIVALSALVWVFAAGSLGIAGGSLVGIGVAVFLAGIKIFETAREARTRPAKP